MTFTVRRAVPLLPLILLIAAAPALATPVWKALGPFGGTVLSVAVDPSSARTVYVTTSTEGVFRSIDTGLTWTKILRAYTPGALAVAPGGVIYVSVNPGKVKKSTDAGGHWTLANRGLPDSIVTSLAVDPVQPSRVYAFLPEGGFWRSVDGGASWEPGNVGLLEARRQVTVKQIAMTPKPAGTVYVASTFGIYKSWDGGQSWHKLRGGLPKDGWTVSVAVSPTDPRTVYATLLSSGVYRSTNGGAKWTRTAGQPRAVSSLAVSPRSPRLVLAGTVADGLFRSTDGGEHWAAVGPASVRFVQTITVGPAARFVYAGLENFGTGEPGGVLASEDGGLTWTRRNRGLAAQEAWKLTVNPGLPGDLWTTSNQGLLVSRDGGASWRRPTLPETAYGAAGGIAIPLLAPSTTYVLTLQGVWRTLDRGDSWSQMSGPASGLLNPFLWADPLDPLGLWSKSNALYRSTNGGVSWSTVPGLDAFNSIAELVFAPSAPRTIYVAGERIKDPVLGSRVATVYRSEDGGGTWARADAGLDTSGIQEIAVDPVDSRQVYAATVGNSDGRGSVWVTSDSGATWSQWGEELRGERIATLAASSIAGVVWAATQDGRIFRSSDRGVSWEERTADFPAASVHGLTFDPFDPQKLYANTSGGVYMTTDEP